MFSDRLKQSRVKKNLSQKEVANMVFVSQQAYAKWEKGLTTPNPDTISKLSKILDVTTDYLLGNEIKKEFNSDLNEKDIKEIDKYMEKVENDLTNASMMFDGEPMDEESLQLVLNSMRIGIEMAKKRNKEKYTPKKHRK